MAEQLDVEMLSALKESNPDYTVVAYINTTSELKTICDVCVTSSSALKIVNNIDNDKILFTRTATLAHGWRSRFQRRHLSLFMVDALLILECP